ncbi:TPA: hypothetical protein ACGFT9_002368, partial [Flavobacterium psychrophilum]
FCFKVLVLWWLSLVFFEALLIVGGLRWLKLFCGGSLYSIVFWYVDDTVLNGVFFFINVVSWMLRVRDSSGKPTARRRRCEDL